MDFEWMEEISWLKKIKDTVAFRQRAGDILNWAPKLGLVPKPSGRKPGISVLMRLKNEARWIELTVRSLAPFVEQFSIVDNGSTDGTPKIVEEVADELSLNYVLEILPTEDFGEVCDRALHNTTCHWVLRWDGDMIARTQGKDSFMRIREFALSLDTDRYYSINFPHIQLEADLFHQDPHQLIHYEDYLFTYSPKLYHRRKGRLREMIYPLYYKY
ncbi:MAG TPA: glycosyltransferase, partial [Anaerolineae bacterium]|nr:glycosyltransferase [Anaerolineae bacterium]